MNAAAFAAHDVLFIRLCSQKETIRGVAAQIDAGRAWIARRAATNCLTALGDPLVIRRFNS
jgi:hypothetical protein